jgi:hypothetical protein
MKKNIIKFFLTITFFLSLVIFYLSIIGLETEKFNDQIKGKITEVNKNIEIELKKTKLVLDPFNFKIEAKTIGTEIKYKGKKLDLEYIKTKISIISLIKNKIVSSNLEVSTRSILFSDFVTFVRAINNKPELFILEKAIKKGYVTAKLEISFDENGKINKDYKISTLLTNGKIELLKKYNYEKINFLLNIKDNIFSFKDISFTANNINFFSNSLKVTRNKKNLLFEGEIENKNSILSYELLDLLKLDLKNIKFLDTNFDSKNFFSFNIDNKFKLKNLEIDSVIKINKSSFKKHKLLNDYLPYVNDLIDIKDHEIKTLYKKNIFTLKGFGKIKFEKKFDEIEYSIINKEKDLNLTSTLLLDELKLKNQEFIRPFFPKLSDLINLKNQQIKINYHNGNLSLKGFGRIKLDKEFEEINFDISTKGKKVNFDSQLALHNTAFKIDFLNFKKDSKLKASLRIIGNYEKNNELNFQKVSILDENNQIILKNLLIDKVNKITSVDEVDLNYFDNENKKNQIFLLRKNNNDYKIDGTIFNANTLITNILESTDEKKLNILKDDITIFLNFDKIFIDDKNIIKNLKGEIKIEDNIVTDSYITAFFNKKKKLTFTIKNNNNEKVTTFYSSKAKPFVKRYKFIKGFEDGDLDFYSSKKNNISNSVLKIDNFKVQEVPALAKILSLASLQGIADLLTGEGIRFTDFEMDFTNKRDLMTINELYAIGPSISILMDGYIQSNNLVSLRGTLVPATTINRTIASIPIVGDLLIGKKVGEGVFGVSFKIKGPPKDLKTTVNPIKTLTPRFITRTLEKISKN